MFSKMDANTLLVLRFVWPITWDRPEVSVREQRERKMEKWRACCREQE